MVVLGQNNGLRVLSVCGPVTALVRIVRLQVPLPLCCLFVAHYKVDIAHVWRCSPEKHIICVLSTAMGKSVPVTGTSPRLKAAAGRESAEAFLCGPLLVCT